VSPQIGHIHVTVDDAFWHWADASGNLPLELQPKLLRVLQEREFERLGGARTVRVNVRVVAATNQDLGQLVRKKLFRAGLFYRLNVIQSACLRGAFHTRLQTPIRNRSWKH